MKRATFLTRVIIENYKSIATCDVQLGPLTYLVGPNGSGKSNFIDALRFVADALNTSLGHALHSRGSFASICHAPHLHQASIAIRLEFILPNGSPGHYGFRIGLGPNGARWEVIEEACTVNSLTNGVSPASFSLKNGQVVTTVGSPPVQVSDRLFLVNAAGQAAFRPVFDALSQMQFYQIQPRLIPDVETYDAMNPLRSDGSNLASVLLRLELSNSSAKQRIEEYLRQILPGLTEINAASAFPSMSPKRNKLGLTFSQRFPDREHLFGPLQMSEGTLRALGILTALFQTKVHAVPPISLVAIEEPEAQVNAAVLGVLRDAMEEASFTTQVLATTHSSDLLDDKDIQGSSILAVVAEEGVTRIGPLDEADLSVLRERLFTPGELLRSGQLTPARNGHPSTVPQTEEARQG